MKAIFICVFFAAVFVGIVSSGYFGLDSNNNRIFKAVKGYTVKILLVLLFAVLSFLGYFLVSHQYREIIAYLLLSICIFLVLLFFRNNNSNFCRTAARAFFWIMLIETVLFNMPSYHLWFGGYKEGFLQFSDAIIEGKGTWELSEDGDKLSIPNEDEVLLYFSEINQPVGTISADVDFGDKCFVIDMIVDITDETHATYRYDTIKQKIYRYQSDSQTTLCHLSGDVGILRIKFTSEQPDCGYSISNIRINEPVPFSVSPVRIILFWGLVLLAYGLIKSRFFNRNLSDSQMSFSVLSLGVFFLAALLSVIMVVSKLDVSEGISSIFLQESGDQMTQELVDAFEAGSVSLLQEPSEELMELENPYDWGLRDLKEVNYLWDHVFYEGKYYSYYGIAPVVLLYLPFHLLTGYYFPTNLSVMIFSVIGLWFLILIYMAVVKKWFKSLSLSTVFSGELVVVFCCGIYYALGRPKFYEAAVSSAFMFLTMGTYFLITSNVVGTGRILRGRLIASSLFLALAVLSRPTMAVYCICACLFYLAGFIKERKEAKGASAVTYWLSAMGPMVILGILQMAYNYVRFGSVLDFGIGYSLTINDFTRVSYHTIYVLILIYNYLLAPVKISAEYPIISADFSRLSVNGYFFKDTGNTPGLLFMALPLFAYLLAGKAIKKLPKKKRMPALILVGFPCVLMPLVTIFAAWSSGYAARYLAAFSWEMIMGAILILFFLCSRCEEEYKRRGVQLFMCAAAIWAIIVNSVSIFNFCFRSSVYPYMAYGLEQLFCFWK